MLLSTPEVVGGGGGGGGGPLSCLHNNSSAVLFSPAIFKKYVAEQLLFFSLHNLSFFLICLPFTTDPLYRCSRDTTRFVPARDRF